MHTILIADDDPDMVQSLRHRCAGLGTKVITASNAASAKQLLMEKSPDLAILDVDMPGGSGLEVAELIATLRSQLRTQQGRDLPCIMLTGSQAEDTIRRCHSACAYYVLKRPNVWTEVEPLVCELLGISKPDAEVRSQGSTNTVTVSPKAMPIPNAKHSDTHEDGETNLQLNLIDSVFTLLGMVGEPSETLPTNPAPSQSEPITRSTAEPVVETERPSEAPEDSDEPWVLSIEDDDDFAFALQMRLERKGIHVIRAAEGSVGYRRAFCEAPRAILLDYELPSGDGAYVLRRLKESPATSAIPVIMLTGRKEAYIQRQVLSLGANRFLNKPLHWDELWQALVEVGAVSTRSRPMAQI